MMWKTKTRTYIGIGRYPEYIGRKYVNYLEYVTRNKRAMGICLVNKTNKHIWDWFIAL